MAFAIYLRYRNEFQPEPPQISDKNINDPNVNFTFVDFIPSVIKRSGTLIPQNQTVEYHPFGTMVDVANEWLQNHGHQWEVINCETIIMPFKYNDTNNCFELKPNDCYFYIYGSGKNNILRALRFWIRKRIEPLDSPQSIRYKDFCPKCNDDESGFEKIDDVVKIINDNLSTNGLDGRIISIESIVFEANVEWEIDTEKSLSTISTKNVYILRIFYENGPKTFAQIGIKDFHPKQLTRATFFKRPRFETFDQVMDRGFTWMRNEPMKRFINAQSIDVKMKLSNAINSRIMAFTEHGDYMRVFRINYIELDRITPPPPPISISSRMFFPYRKTDTIADIQQRLSEWINQYLEKLSKKKLAIINDNRELNKEQQQQQQQQQQQLIYPTILSAETVEVFAKDFGNISRAVIEKTANNDTFLANRFGHKNAYLFYLLRVFFDDIPMVTSDSVTNVTMISDSESVWTINSFDAKK